MDQSVVSLNFEDRDFYASGIAAVAQGASASVFIPADCTRISAVRRSIAPLMGQFNAWTALLYGPIDAFRVGDLLRLWIEAKHTYKYAIEVKDDARGINILFRPGASG